MRTDCYAVIMAGGKGERFWPLSTSRHPKQVLRLFGDQSLLEMALARLDGLVPMENVLIITSEELVEPTCAGAPGLPRENVIGEPFGRDTAAAVALGAALIQARNPNAVFCVVTADHIIGDLDVFQRTLSESFDLARAQDVLITMGINPSYPATGFGYIDAGDAVDHDAQTEFFMARRFVEKPGLSKAETYLAAGHYYWNSGMFIWSVESIVAALQIHHPPAHGMAAAMTAAAGTPEFAGRLREEYEQLERISIDYAIMEKADNIVMAKGTFRWSDVGSWPALDAHFTPDAQENIALGQFHGIDSGSNIVISEDRLTALIGVDDMVVVHAEGATLVCPKARAQDVKALVTQLKEDGRFEELL